MWAREVKHAAESTAEENSTKQTEQESCFTMPYAWKLLERLAYALFCVAIFVLIGLIIYFIMHYGFTDYDFEYNESAINPDYGYFLTGFVVVFVALGSIMTLLVIAMFWLRYISEKGCCTTPYAVVAGESEKAKKCKKQLFIAQIVQDLPVIVGLTCMAVGTTLQRGVSNYSLILTVILLMTTTGVTTHMTNVLRIMSLRFQGKMMTKTENASTLTASMKKIQFNRVSN